MTGSPAGGAGSRAEPVALVRGRPGEAAPAGPAGRTEPAAQNLFEIALGPAFATLPAAVRNAHGRAVERRFCGAADIVGGASAPARVARALSGMPRRGRGVPLTVRMSAAGGSERWTRTFGRRTLATQLSCPRKGVIEERLGPVTFALAVRASERGLTLSAARARVGPLGLPRWLTPAVSATEEEAGGAFQFDIAIALPLGLGEVVRYRGTLRPCRAPDGPCRAADCAALAQNANRRGASLERTPCPSTPTPCAASHGLRASS